ncbi:hypothetical protein MCOR02_008098 [Pyricularia oryzae]|uniref:Poly(A) polymerase n=1 Tax=Pyricularia oryzae (strain 70-15 / ATCC MYA-4617 / FGSC 8958) TaxID=242507 RepID=G4N852_PYRO7|nr:Poly(A) polymerase pla1 [Pyricularia oryzae 70-15]KAH9430769.1 hypothetical protein MCOR02_008098 [Pyricularia oryzae]EHA50953.1 Poly(A) polymerase pla1 [Pyricularia oryzae 70-15]KAI6320715.1 hypothetical protein MCOR34_002935 [Pyricularia oryzae]KAI6460710.1 hypothetical protein MCOR17_006588 [Pyricularia oryzae]KAI6508283.1 hypothetical protein MCOR13_002267 [Pyricularia oryzae]
METERQLGVTPPVSVHLPTEEEKQATDSLLAELRAQNSFEGPVETEKRFAVLRSLQEIADAFVKTVARKKEPDNAVLIKDARGKVFAYGSLRLGVWGPGSDIDTLVVAPRYVTREDYFEHFPGLLVEMAPPNAITDLSVVVDAFVPIIKFEFSGISIDLIFSRIATMKQLPADPNWNLSDSNLLRGLDEKELRSVNGTRVTDEIISLVPEQNVFRTALRAIKLWAQRRAIYGNIVGFPGGVAWAMLVARVCQLYPRATASVVVNKFFCILMKWPWPQPVLLKAIEDGPLQARIWNPKIYPGDRYHLMPIITPAYPSMCATFNITKSSKDVIGRELVKAADLTNLIMVGKLPWKDLFQKHTFFTKDFKYYIQVIAASKDKESHKLWSGFVESKVRLLVQGLERHESIAVARPFIKGYDRSHRYYDDSQFNQILEGSLANLCQDKDPQPEAKPEVPVKEEPVSNGTHTNGIAVKDEVAIKQEGHARIKSEDCVDPQPLTENIPGFKGPSSDMYTTTFYIGLELRPEAKSLDLSFQVNDFKWLCYDWAKYKEDLTELCFVNIKDLRSFALPDDIFGPGETKPVKRLVKKKVPVDRKRPANEDNQAPAKRHQPATVGSGV